jgi:hypothetical protein
MSLHDMAESSSNASDPRARKSEYVWKYVESGTELSELAESGRRIISDKDVTLCSRLFNTVE